MKRKILKLAVFNLCFVIATIFLFSQNGLGLGFTPTLGAFKFALSCSLGILGTGGFIFVNYNIMTHTKKIKFEKLSTIDECIESLIESKESNPSFSNEISKAIDQLQTLQRRNNSLTILLEQNNIEESYQYLNETSKKTNSFVFNNVKRIINRLVVFDNEGYLKNNDNLDIQSHQEYISEVLKDNDNILKEYSSFLVTLSAIGDTQMTNLEEIQSMTEALLYVLKGKKTFEENTIKPDDN